MNHSNIAILTTVANFQLYERTSVYFPENIRKFVIDGNNGMHGIHSIKFMMKMLKNENIEWLIMADEDVIFTDSNVVFSIIDKMKSENYTFSGIRDGGVISHRNFNPNVINTFFSILNFKEIESIWDEKEMLKNQYVIENEFSQDFTNLKNEFDDQSIFEPYYCFYFWLRRLGKKVLFLDAEIQNDLISNSVFFENKTFMYHTWYARSYNVNDKHTRRINNLFNSLEIKNNNKNILKPIIFIDKSFYFKQKLKKLIKKITYKIV